MWVYKENKAGLWTAGFYDPNGTWHAESDHDNKDAAANRINFLHGGDANSRFQEIEKMVEVEAMARMRILAIEHRATLISSYTRFDNGRIDEPDINRDIQTLNAFIDQTGEGLPDEICAKCWCYKSSHNWRCADGPQR